MTAAELYRAGKLAEAVDAASQELRSKPTDVDLRAFLVDLLAISGELERADKQLDALGRQVPEAAPAVAMARHLMRAAMARDEVFTQGRTPELLAPPPEHLELRMRALVEIRAGEWGPAAELLAEAEEKRPPLPGRTGEGSFDDFRDGDDLLGGIFEVLTSTGKYYWIPAETVQRLEPKPVERPRDLLWRRVGMEVASGPDGEVWIPAIYPDYGSDLEPAARLGRLTEWRGGEGSPVLGVGLRTFLVGEEARTLLELDELTFGDAG